MAGSSDRLGRVAHLRTWRGRFRRAERESRPPHPRPSLGGDELAGDGGDDPAGVVAATCLLVEDRVGADEAEHRDEVAAEPGRAGRHQLGERLDVGDDDAVFAMRGDPALQLVPSLEVDEGVGAVFEVGERVEDAPCLLGRVVG